MKWCVRGVGWWLTLGVSEPRIGHALATIRSSLTTIHYSPPYVRLSLATNY